MEVVDLISGGSVRISGAGFSLVFLGLGFLRVLGGGFRV